MYRINYSLWGLKTYMLYQLPLVLLHVGAAVLLRAVMRRLSVRGRIATVAALFFVSSDRTGGKIEVYGSRLSGASWRRPD